MALRVEHPDDAIVYRYVSRECIASLVVPCSMIHLYEQAGWKVLVRQDDLRWCDWYDTMKEEIKKWRKGDGA